MTVFTADFQDTVEVIDNADFDDFNQAVEKYREKTGYFAVENKVKETGHVIVTRLQPAGPLTVEDERREKVYDATNRILEYARATNPGGQTSEEFQRVENAVDTILSTIGVPDRVVNE